MRFAREELGAAEMQSDSPSSGSSAIPVVCAAESSEKTRRRATIHGGDRGDFEAAENETF